MLLCNEIEFSFSSRAEVLGASVVAFFPGSGVNQTMTTAFVLFGYLAGVSYFKPYPISLINKLDVLSQICLLFQIVRSSGENSTVRTVVACVKLALKSSN